MQREVYKLCLKVKAYICIAVLLGVFVSCKMTKQATLHGKYNETYWGPMSENYLFNSDSTFFHFYSDDTYGIYSKGKYILTGNILALMYDSLLIDQPLISKIRKDDSDSLKIKLSVKSKSADLIQVYDKSKILLEKIYYTDTIKFTVKRPCRELKICFYADYDLKKDKLFEFALMTEGVSECFIEYYPSNSWYEFNKFQNKVLKLRKFTNSSFEIKSGKMK